MASISDLRNRSKTAKDLQEQRVNRVREAVVEVVNSSAFTLSALNNLQDADESRVQSFANEVAEKVAVVVTDPKIEFLDACRNRGLVPSQIRRAVKLVNEVYGLTTSEDYEEQLKAVAEYVQTRPHLYDEFAGVLTKH